MFRCLRSAIRNEPGRQQVDRTIDNRDRLILALDVDSAAEARRWVETLGDTVRFYKLGLQLCMAPGYFELLEWLHQRGCLVFVDLKFFDVPRTVAAAVRQLRGCGATFVTVHGNDAMLRAAVDAGGEELGILAVTVLTSLDQGDLDDLGFQCDPEALVLSRARRALEIGCRGVVCSGQEAARLREKLPGQLTIVTPGIRPIANTDDQKRVVTVAEAFANGADYIVIGRPILQAADPVQAAREAQAEIARVLADV